MVKQLLVCVAVLTSSALGAENYDVAVYGGTAGGVVAAVQAARMGKSVVLVEPGRHVGGMTSGGLGATDFGNPRSIGGVSREFYQRILKYYQQAEAWKQETQPEYSGREKKFYHGDALFGFEPQVAERVLEQMLSEAKVVVVRGERLELKNGVSKEGGRIASMRMESGRVVAAKVFIDASYEGDLMAKAGVEYTVGREANAQYGESLSGVQVGRSKSHQFTVLVDAFVKAGDRSSGLLANVQGEAVGVDGEADRRVQAYNYRLCLTDVAENRVAFAKPQGYDERDFEVLLRSYDAGFAGVAWNRRGMPNRKTDSNNQGAFSTDFIGQNYDYPDADYATREKIIAAHEKYVKGLLWTVANHPRVPEKVRAQASQWGLAKDEFVDSGNFPRQLYVREGRRMVGGYVMTELDVIGKRKSGDSVGLGSYGMDSHNTQRYVDSEGHVRNEGDVEVHGFAPYGISYRSLAPKAGQCGNLLVPVCMSASHMAYGSIRMEPVYMILGQACGTAAALAIDEGVEVQRVSYERLRERLVADKQLVEWSGGEAAVRRGRLVEGTVVDFAKAKLTGEWSTGSMGGYLHDGDEGKGSKSARFEATLPRAGRYEVRLGYMSHANRATNVPVTVVHADGEVTVRVNQRMTPPIEGASVSLGTFRFGGEGPAVVTVSNAGTDGHVIVEAVQFLER